MRLPPQEEPLPAAHHAGHHGGIVVFGKQVQVIVELPFAFQECGEPTERVVVEGVEVVELHALLAFELVRVIFLQFALIGRQERSVHVVGYVQLERGVFSVAKLVQPAYHFDDALERVPPALRVASGTVEIGKRCDDMHLVARVHVCDMPVFRHVENGQIAAHDEVARTACVRTARALSVRSVVRSARMFHVKHSGFGAVVP